MDTRQTVAIYNKVAIGLTAVLSAIGLALAALAGWDRLITPVAVSAAYSLASAIAYIYGWKAVAQRAPEALPKYYLAGSAFRLMAAATVLLVYCVAQRHDIAAIKWFAAVFIVFYIVMLAFDALFFAKISKTDKK